MGTASYNHSGVSRETTRDRDGILLPFFYLTYYLRDRSTDNATVDKSVVTGGAEELSCWQEDDVVVITGDWLLVSGEW